MTGSTFLGFHIRWKRKRGTNRWHVYTFIADRPIRSLKTKVRALTNRTLQQNPGDRAGPAEPDHARLVQLLQARSRQTSHRPPVELRVAPGDPVAAGAAPLDGEGRPPQITPPRPVETRPRRTGSNFSTWKRYRSPGTATGAIRSPTPGPCQPRPTAAAVESPVREKRTPGSASGLGKRTDGNTGTAPQADSTGQGGRGVRR